ncbi:CDP-alcohol phosphatidyltransferase family protein [Thermodesulfobacteriota bacterium]
MLDGLFKAKIDLFWNRLGPLCVKLGLTPNMVTLGGLVFVVLSCLYFVRFENSLYFGIFLAFSFTTDALDGAVARITGKTTRYGSYLDAVVDRYQEILVYFAIAYVRGYWLGAFLAITGSLLVSYNKARTALEMPVSNDSWPDLLERTERLVLITVALLIDGLFPGKDILRYAVILIAGLAHFTAIQRFLRARKLLREEQKK